MASSTVISPCSRLCNTARRVPWASPAGAGAAMGFGAGAGVGTAAIQIAKGGSHFTADTKGGVERAARTQTRQQEVGIGIFGVRITDGDDFAIALQQDFVGTLAAIAEVDLGFPVVTEGGVEDAG